LRPVLAVIAAMPEEVSALRRRLTGGHTVEVGRTRVLLGALAGRPVAVAVVGDGAHNARRGTAELLAAMPVERALLVGVSGALTPDLEPGALVVARAVTGVQTVPAPADEVAQVALATGARPGLVVSVADLVETPQHKARLRTGHGAGSLSLVVDLESAAVVAVLAAAGIPWVVLRAVSDTASEALPPILRRCRDSAGLHRGRLLAGALRRPPVLAELWRLGRRMRLCADALARAVEQVIAPVEGEAGHCPRPSRTPSRGWADERITMTNLDTLLAKTSRTFALSISFLPEALRREVTIAYLLFRVADTLEDADLWPREVRGQALDDLARVVAGGDPSAVEPLSRRWIDPAPVKHAGYLELLASSRLVLDAFEALPEAHREVIRKSLLGTITGMKDFLGEAERAPLRLGSIDELRRYCHVVAGIVGEMLTALFVLHEPALVGVAPFLEERASAFGECLQLINILKDRNEDAAAGRHYLPVGVPLGDVVALAGRSLKAAEEYTAAIQQAGGLQVLGFNLLLCRLARASLLRVEQEGPGAKISRLEVLAIVTGVQAELVAAQAAVATPAAAYV
jgi:farnesyl-diphosphate farnesyltransferase